MSTVVQRKSDYATREAVEAELQRAPQIADAAEIGVAVANGVVTLSGEVSAYPQKQAAGEVTLRTPGVTVIANDLVVRHSSNEAPDATCRGAALASRVHAALSSAAYVPRDCIDIDVCGDTVRLSGTVRWEHQRVAAERAVEVVPGVRRLRSDLRLRPRVDRAEIEAALRRVLAPMGVEPGRVLIDVDGAAVRLTGTVASYLQRRAAGQVVMSVPSVRAVSNELRIVRPVGAKMVGHPLKGR